MVPPVVVRVELCECVKVVLSVPVILPTLGSESGCLLNWPLLEGKPAVLKDEECVENSDMVEPPV